jgi:hypothetical protein
MTDLAAAVIAEAIAADHADVNQIKNPEFPGFFLVPLIADHAAFAAALPHVRPELPVLHATIQRHEAGEIVPTGLKPMQTGGRA